MRKSIPSNVRIRVRPWLGFGVGLLLLVVIGVIGVTRVDELASELTALLMDESVKQTVVIDELDDVVPKNDQATRAEQAKLGAAK